MISIRRKVAGTIAGLAAVAVIAGAGVSLASTTTAVPATPAIYGCVTPAHALEYVYTTESGFQGFLAAHGGNCPGGASEVTLVGTAATTTATPTPTPTATASNTASPTPTPTASATTTAPGSWACTVTTNANCPGSGNYDAGLNSGTYGSVYVSQDEWNPASALKSQVLSANGASDWQVTASIAAGNTAVLSYPDTQDTVTNTADQPDAYGDFASLDSTYSVALPANPGASDDYEAAYDIWLGTATANYAQEIMVWTDNHGQVPAGTDTGKTWTDASTGDVYEVWATGNDSTVTLAAKDNSASGSVDLLSLFSWLKSSGYSTETGVNQVDYGFELCSTSGAAETFVVKDYTVTGTCSSGNSC